MPDAAGSADQHLDSIHRQIKTGADTHTLAVVHTTASNATTADIERWTVWTTPHPRRKDADAALVI